MPSPNPLLSQGTLNRIVGSVIVPSFPVLNVTAPFLGKEGIRLALEGESTKYIPTMTGAVTSPEPYMMIRLTINLLKTQSLSALYKAQMETLALVGDIAVNPDVTLGLPPYDLTNCAIQDVRELNFSGEDAGFVVTLGGYYYINVALFNLQ